MKYLIPAENIAELRKKVNTIRKKAIKYGVTVEYTEGEEVFKSIKNEHGVNEIRKYIEVEAEGEAKANGWVFAGTIEHTEQGNILRSIADDFKIPARYRDAKPYCEHCNTLRNRKDTYIVYNEQKSEYKQVGKTCLKEYTNGLDAGRVACIMQFIDDMEQACVPSGSSFTNYYKVSEIAKYCAEALHKFGWTSSSLPDSTKVRALDFYWLDNFKYRFSEKKRDALIALAKEVGFNAESVDEEYIESAFKWAKDWDNHEYNDYRDNLKVIASMEYCEYKHLGYLASLFMSYDKAMDREIKQAERAKTRKDSTYIGSVGDKVEAEIKDWKCLTSWDTMYGTTYLYEFITNDGNIIIWKTSKYLDDDIKGIKGTVKAHAEFRSIKQTELTRCKVS